MIIIMTMIMIMIIIIIILLRTSCYKRQYEDGDLIYICNFYFRIAKKTSLMTVIWNIIIIIILIIMIITMIMIMIIIIIIIIIILLRTSRYKRQYEDGHLIYICNYHFKMAKKTSLMTVIWNIIIIIIIIIIMMMIIIIIIIIIIFNQSAHIIGLVFRIERPCVTKYGLKSGRKL